MYIAPVLMKVRDLLAQAKLSAMCDADALLLAAHWTRADGAHPYWRLRFDNISHLSQRLRAQNNAPQHSGFQQNTPGRMRTSLIGKKQSTPNALR
jgi:hypothetical protein